MWNKLLWDPIENFNNLWVISQITCNIYKNHYVVIEW